jgi:plastocyanin
VSAKKYEFSPAIITVKQGDHVRPVITATDRDHGFEVKAHRINQHLKKGLPGRSSSQASESVLFPLSDLTFADWVIVT